VSQKYVPSLIRLPVAPHPLVGRSGWGGRGAGVTVIGAQAAQLVLLIRNMRPRLILVRAVGRLARGARVELPEGDASERAVGRRHPGGRDGLHSVHVSRHFTDNIGVDGKDGPVRKNRISPMIAQETAGILLPIC